MWSSTTIIAVTMALGTVAVVIKRAMRKKKTIVTAVRLNGTIGSDKTSDISFESTYKQIKTAFDIEEAKAIALLINSPGGRPVQSHEVYTFIREKAKETKKPVYAFIEDVCASGGYYIACAADFIYASPSSIVGSIGVVSSGFGLKGLIEKLGIERRVHTQGKNKCILDPFRDEKAEDIEILKGIQSECHEVFINIVKASRKEKLGENPHPDLFTGLFWTGTKAKELGLVDEIGSHYVTLRQLFGDDLEIKYMKEKKSMLQKLQELTSLETFAKSAIETTISQLKLELSMNRFGL
jgi:signal peptide peptidase SppA